MTNEQKEQIINYKSQGMGYKKISQLMGMSENTVKSFCKRSRQEVTEGVCPSCGRAIESLPGKKAKKFCSDKCRMRWWNANLDRVQRKANYDFICACCKKPFTAYGNAHRKYCSRGCYIEDRFGGGGNV